MAAPRKSPIVALLVALVGLAVAVFVGTQNSGDEKAPTTASTTSTSTTATEQASGVPQAAWATLAAIDAGRWPPDDAPGTQGGRTFGNHEGGLPRPPAGRRSATGSGTSTGSRADAAGTPSAS